MRRPFYFKIASTNGLAALPAFTPGVLVGGRAAMSNSAHANIEECASAQKRLYVQGYRTKYADQRKSASGNQTKGTDDEKSQEDRDFSVLLVFAATSVAHARFL